MKINKMIFEKQKRTDKNVNIMRKFNDALNKNCMPLTDNNIKI